MVASVGGWEYATIWYPTLVASSPADLYPRPPSHAQIQPSYHQVLTERPISEIRQICLGTWTSKMPKRMDPLLPILFTLGDWAITLGTSGGPVVFMVFGSPDLKGPM